MSNFLKNTIKLGVAIGIVYTAILLVRQKTPVEQPPKNTPVETPPDRPNLNPVDAPPTQFVTDPLKIACAEDFQDWEQLGCQG